MNKRYKQLRSERLFSIIQNSRAFIQQVSYGHSVGILNYGKIVQISVVLIFSPLAKYHFMLE